MQSQGEKPDFSFMMNSAPPSQNSRSLPKPSKTIKYIMWGIGAIIVIVIAATVLQARGSSGSQALVNAVARCQETLRVTTYVQQQLSLQDPQTQALAATAASTLASDEKQLKNYLAANHITVTAAQLAADTDKATDSSLQAASQNNNLDAAYAAYLAQALTRYQNDLQDAYKSAGANGKVLLTNIYNSAGTMLSAPPLKSP